MGKSKADNSFFNQSNAHQEPEKSAESLFAELYRAVKKNDVFAAKEAISKAFGTGIGNEIEFKDIVISNNEAGCPMVTIDRDIAIGKNIFLSIADEIDVAVAFAVISA